MKKLTATEKMKIELMQDQEFASDYKKIDQEVSLAIELQKERKRIGITQKEMSLQTGIAQADISKIETGNGNPTINTLSKMGKVLGLTLQWRILD